MERISIKASLREEKGKNSCKALRKKGMVPGIVYKGGKDGMAVYVDAKELWSAMHTKAGENAIITLDISDAAKKSQKTVIVQESQQDPITDKILHVDFHEISLTEKIKVDVPIVLKGEAPGVKEEGGILSQVIWELKVECTALEIPESIIVMVDKLKINDAIHVKELTVPPAVHVLEDADQVVVHVSPPQAEEVAAPEAALEEGMEEPEVIKKGKKEEEGEEGEEEAGAKEKPAADKGADTKKA